MAVKIRLRAQGAVNRTVYRIVIADSQAPRDGKYIEAIGWFHPRAKADVRVNLKPDRLQYWLDNGAVPSEKIQDLMKKTNPEILVAWRKKNVAKQAKLTKKRSERKAAKKKKAKAKK
jgi:small subunit ribosomal protein S16